MSTEEGDAPVSEVEQVLGGREPTREVGRADARDVDVRQLERVDDDEVHTGQRASAAIWSADMTLVTAMKRTDAPVGEVLGPLRPEAPSTGAPAGRRVMMTGVPDRAAASTTPWMISAE